MINGLWSRTSFQMNLNLITCSRIKMDPNRNPSECCEDALSLLSYDEYHEMIDANFRRAYMAKNRYAQGLVIDIHSQRHAENWVELGYVISADELNTTPSSAFSALRAKSSLGYMSTLSG